MGTVTVKHKDAPEGDPGRVISERALPEFEARGWKVDAKASKTDRQSGTAGTSKEA